VEDHKWSPNTHRQSGIAVAPQTNLPGQGFNGPPVSQRIFEKQKIGVMRPGINSLLSYSSS
jgi:hypothetical protein